MKNEPGHLGPLPDDFQDLSKILRDHPPIEKNIYGPGDDDYGRNKPFWKKTQKELDEDAEALKKCIKIEKELCVNCGVETPYTKDTHIDYRNYYVEGAGQLCKECYDKIYKVKDDRKYLVDD